MLSEESEGSNGPWPSFDLIISFTPVERFFQSRGLLRASKTELDAIGVFTFPFPISKLQTIFSLLLNLARSFL